MGAHFAPTLKFPQTRRAGGKGGRVGTLHRVINYKEDRATQIVFDWKFHEFRLGWVISTIPNIDVSSVDVAFSLSMKQNH